MTGAVQTPPRTARATWWMPVCLVVVAVLVRLPAFLSAPSLVFDDGQYGVSVVDMRKGFGPYTRVFSSQGPLHYPLLYAGDLLGFRTINGPRVAPVLAGVFVTVGVWAIARRLGASDPTAFLCGLLIATTGSMIWTTGQVTSDGLAAAFVVATAWAAVVYRDRPVVWRAVLVGVMYAGAIGVKPLIGAVAIPAGWWLWSARRRLADLVIAGVAAVVTWFVIALPWGLSRVYDQSIGYHTGEGPRYGKGYQFNKLFSTLLQRDTLIVLALLLGLIAAARHVTKLRDRPGDALVLGVWAGFVAILLVFEKALYANHLATLVIPLVLLVAVRPPPLKWFGIGFLVLISWHVFNLYDMVRPRTFDRSESALVRDLRSLPSGSTAISDDPQYVWRAGRSTPPLMNDLARARIDQGSITTENVIDAALTDDNCAVVIWSFRFGSLLPNFRSELARAGYSLAREYGEHRELWLRDSCENRFVRERSP
jgi:hypothetical protein